MISLPWISSSGEALNVRFSPVAYLTETETHAAIYQVIGNVNRNHDFLSSVDRQTIVDTGFDMLLTCVTCSKHEGFREEREWRAIYFPYQRPSTLMESSTEVIGGVPQIVHKIPLDITVSEALADLEFSRVFDRLIIGPSQYPLPMCEAFHAALANAGIAMEAGTPQRIFISGIPIRS